MTRIAIQWPLILLGVAALASGCEQTSSEAVTTEMHEDFDHDHEHVHGAGQDHEHEHADGHEGRHSHPHSHSHRHGEPLHGGRIVSIGHTHHQDGEAHYHAEVMPVTDGTITFHILTESVDGASRDFPVEATEVTAYVNASKGESTQPVRALETTFAAVGAPGSAEFRSAVPEQFAQIARLSIVVPKIVLGGERFSFSFTASRAVSSQDSESAGQETAE